LVEKASKLTTFEENINLLNSNISKQVDTLQKELRKEIAEAFKGIKIVQGSLSGPKLIK
jgi:hypothetical protein